jgi:hydroxypyruvate isomerase
MTMNRLSAHIGYLFTELPLEKRVAAAAAAGFTAIEHPQPFAIPAKRMREMLADNNLVFTQLAAATGDANKGEKGISALAGRDADFRASFDRSLEYALEVGAPLVHPMAGVPEVNATEAWWEIYMSNITYAVEQSAATSARILIEAIGHAAVPGYAVSRLEDAARIQDAFGPGNVSLLVDTFHAASNGQDVISWIDENAHRIGHVHIADYPGRHEPGTGTVDFDGVLDVLAKNEFSGAIGFEYVPSTNTLESAQFLARWKARPGNSASR